MTDHQLEAYFIFAILGISVPIVGFLIAVILTLRARGKRKAIADEILDHSKRKNGKHKNYGEESEK